MLLAVSNNRNAARVARQTALVFLVIAAGAWCTTRAETIEDFDGHSLIASWWGSDAIPPYCYQLDFTSTQHVHSGQYALRVDYDKANDAGSPFSFLSAAGGFNLKNFDYLSFWVYNDGSPLKIKIRFEERYDKAWETDWAGIFPATQTTDADWENLVVDLTRTFSSTNLDFGAVRQIMFMVMAGSNTGSGTFWLDDMCLQRSPNEAPLEPFESDFYGWAAGGPFSVLRVTNDFHNDGTPTGLGQHALKVTWGTKDDEDYSNYTYTPRHDTNSAPVGRIGNYPNFRLRTNTTLSLWVKSPTDNNMPLLVKLNDDDIDTINYTGSGAWQELSYNYRYNPSATDVETVYFMPYPGAGDDGGVLYVDDMRLTGGESPPIPLAPTGLAATAFSDGACTVNWSRVTLGHRYQLQESRDQNFDSVVDTYTTNLFVTLAKDPRTESGPYYYRVRSSAIDGVTEVFGNYSRPIRTDVPAEANRRCEVVESCDGESLVSAWWGSDAVEPYCYQLDFTSTQHVRSGQYALRIDYDKANDADSPYSFLAASGLYNLSNFDYLTFWAYNDGTPLWIKVRFEDAAGVPWEADWAAIFPATSTPGADWENLVVDLTRTFSATNVNWQAIRHIMFMVEPGHTNAAGTLWLDDVALHRAANSAPIETFESDYYGWAASDLFTLGLDSNVFFNEGAPSGIGHRSLRMSWGSKDADYSNMTCWPEHDVLAPAGRVGNYTNFTLDGNHSIELVVRSPSETNLPILLKLDDVDVGVCSYTGTGEWQRLVWCFSHLGGAVDVSRLYIIPYPNQADDGGMLYLDDVNLTGGSPPAVPYAPHGLAHDADEMEEDGSYTLTWGDVSGAAGYEVQEDTDRDFDSPTACTVMTSTLAMAKNPKVEMGYYYYRVRSFTVAGGVTNYGSCSRSVGPVRVIPDSIDKAEIIEDFDGNSLVTGWWGSDAVEPWAYQLDFTSTQHVHSGEYALRVDYDKANAPDNPYTFLSAAGYFNLGSFDYLSFWVYNDGTPLWIKLRIEGQSWSNAWETDWAGIFPRTCTPEADWENLVVDLTRTFSAANVDWTQVRQIMFMIEPGSTNAAGTFWLDDIKLWRGPNSAPWEPFEADMYGWGAGDPFALALSSNVCHNDGSVTNGLGQRSMKVTWGAKAADYANFTYEPAHDAAVAPAGRIGNYTNLALNGNRVLQAWVRSDTEADLPILLKFDSVIADIGVKTYTGTGEWQKLSWDFSLFGGLDDVQKVFFFPYPGAADGGGELYIDDVNLVGGAPPPFATTPKGVATTASDPDHDGTYSLSWTPVEGATVYEIHESSGQAFDSYVTYYTTNAAFAFNKDPDIQAGAYYYRVRACLLDGGVTHTSSFGVPVMVRVATRPSAQNRSYATDCAEVDNINIPIAYPGATSYRITATHPKYYPTSIGERGADFDDCSFTDKGIWRLGDDDSSCSEFAQEGFYGSDVYHAPDNPGAGTDEPVEDFPKEINRSWMTNQYI
ncbi:MAG: hypothetical protein JXB04_02500, partial [Kiritimatiellae bacterium]|nr:hypothetical protein [Kiritimatiellia bacterium]